MYLRYSFRKLSPFARLAILEKLPRRTFERASMVHVRIAFLPSFDLTFTDSTCTSSTDAYVPCLAVRIVLKRTARSSALRLP